LKKQESVYAETDLFKDAERLAKHTGFTKSKILTSWIEIGQKSADPVLLKNLKKATGE